MDNNKERKRQDDLTNEEVLANVQAEKQTLNIVNFGADGNPVASKFAHTSVVINRTKGVDDQRITNVQDSGSIENVVSQLLNTSFSGPVSESDRSIYAAGPTGRPFRVFKSGDWYYAVDERDVRTMVDPNKLNNLEAIALFSNLKNRGSMLLFTNKADEHKGHICLGSVVLFQIKGSVLDVPSTDYQKVEGVEPTFDIPYLENVKEVTNDFRLLSRLTGNK
jgi:hypothetical protein